MWDLREIKIIVGEVKNLEMNQTEEGAVGIDRIQSPYHTQHHPRSSNHFLLPLHEISTIQLLCCESGNNGDKNRRRKTRTQYTNFTWFGNVTTSMGTVAKNFTTIEIGTHKRVFIILSKFFFSEMKNNNIDSKLQ